MASRSRRLAIVIVLYAIIMGIDLLACMTTFVNDSNGEIAIFNELDTTFMFIKKNGKRRFGDHHKHAHFAIYLQKEKTPLWSPAYTCKQNECGNNGNVMLKFSDIENGTDATQLFTVTKHKPHSSMVRTLPMIQKKSCDSCPGE